MKVGKKNVGKYEGKQTLLEVEEEIQFTCDHKSPLGGAESSFSSQLMFGTALIRFKTIFRSYIFDM